MKSSPVRVINLLPNRAMFFRKKADIMRHVRGDAFYRVFDEAFGILYIDLKILAGACGSIPQETDNVVSVHLVQNKETRAGHLSYPNAISDVPACKSAPTETGIDKDTPMPFLPVRRGEIPRGASLHRSVSIGQLVDRLLCKQKAEGSSPSGYIPAGTSYGLPVHGAGNTFFNTNPPHSPCADSNDSKRRHADHRGTFPEHDTPTPGEAQRRNWGRVYPFPAPPPDYRDSSYPEKSGDMRLHGWPDVLASHALSPHRKLR